MRDLSMYIWVWLDIVGDTNSKTKVKYNNWSGWEPRNSEGWTSTQGSVLHTVTPPLRYTSYFSNPTWDTRAPPLLALSHPRISHYNRKKFICMYGCIRVRVLLPHMYKYTEYVHLYRDLVINNLTYTQVYK